MQHTTLSRIAAPLAALLLASCGERAPGSAAAPESTAPQSAMRGMPQGAQAAAEHMAEGTLNAIDAAKGMVNISHGPVASASWPAMTMSFKLADPNAASGLTPGQRVQFHFTIQSGMSATVTQIAAAE